MTENRVEVFPQGRVHEQIARHRFAATSNPTVCWCGARTGNEVHSGLPWTPGDEWTDSHKAVLARDNLLIRGEVGSGVHGVTVGSDDIDHMGICVEPQDYVLGLKRFKQYIYRTAPEGIRSRPGDLDLTVYSLRKWLRLASAGNPTILLMLFIPAKQLTQSNHYADILRGNAERFMSKQCAGRFIGYLCSQRDQMLGLRGKKHTNRPELIDQYGFDTKFAYHAIRLGIQGNEYLNTGRLTLPMPETDRKWLIELREGKRTKQEALDRIDAELDLLRRIELHPTLLPAQADHRWINDYSIDTHQEWWELRELRKWTTP